MRERDSSVGFFSIGAGLGFKLIRSVGSGRVHNFGFRDEGLLAGKGGGEVRQGPNYGSGFSDQGLDFRLQDGFRVQGG